jgi:hypothetical protein
MYSDQDIANLLARVQQLEIQAASRPTGGQSGSGLTSPNFLTRAFAVWGHFFVANLLIGLIISCVIGVIGLIVGGSVLSIFQNLIHNLSGYSGY